MKLKVSVIIPAYNQENLVIKAIDSVPKRDDIEIIVIDDGSTDKTRENLKAHLNKRDFRLYFNEKNKGVSFTINRGYDMAKGEYVVLLGSDDYFYSSEFEKAMNMLDGTDLVYFNLEVNNGDVWILTPLNKTGLCGSVKFMRRKFIGNTRCPLNKIAGEDYDFFLELLKKNPTEKFSNLIVKHYNFPRSGSLYDTLIKGRKE